MTGEEATPANCNPTGPKSLSIDLCLPASCSIADLTIILGSLKSTCHFNDIRTQERGSIAGTYITAVIMCFCLALGISASIFDYFFLPLYKDQPFVKS